MTTTATTRDVFDKFVQNWLQLNDWTVTDDNVSYCRFTTKFVIYGTLEWILWVIQFHYNMLLNASLFLIIYWKRKKNMIDRNCITVIIAQV